MGKTFRRLLTGLGVLLAIAVVALLAVVLGLPSNRQRLPNPNGYDEFVKAGQQVIDSPGRYPDLDHKELEALVSDNAEALRLLRVGLDEKCLMPVDSALSNMNELMSQMSGMKSLAQLLAAEGRLHEMDNQPVEAARSYTDAMRLGNEMSRGGLLITRLVGVACEAIGCQRLAKVLPRLSREESCIVMADLQAIDTTHVTWAEVIQAERSCTRYHIMHNLNPVEWAVGWWNTRQSVQKAEFRNKSVLAHERLLMADLALRCYKSERQNLPARLEDLVPKYISKVPQDPFSQGPMVYRPQAGATWLVYSVGPDGVDDGGRPAAKGWPVKGDIRVDSTW